MVNEATAITSPKTIKRYRVSDSHQISKGTLLALSTADYYAYASNSAQTNQIFAGIAVEEKTAGDGITEIGACIDGDWDIYNNGSTTSAIGQVVILSLANAFGNAVAADLLTGAVIGVCHEAAGTSEKVKVRLGL